MIPRRGPWIALASVVVVGVMALVVWPWVQRRQYEKQLSAALAALHGCLFDGDDRSDALLRKRAIGAQLAGGDWPASCSVHAADIEVALGALRTHANVDRARAMLDKTRAALGHGRFSDEAAAALFDGAELDRIATKGELPKPLSPSTPRGKPLMRARIMACALALSDGGGWRLLLHATKRQLILCDVSPREATADCHAVPASVPVADAVLLIDGAPQAPPHLLARRDGEIAPEAWAIYDATTGKLRLALQHDPMGATVTPTERVVAVVRQGDSFFFMDGGEPLELELGDRALGPPLVFGESVMWPVARDGGIALKERGIGVMMGSDKERIYAEQTALVIDDWAPAGVAMQACRSGSMTAILMLADPPSHDSRGAVAFRTSEGWKWQRTEIGSQWFGYTCQDGAVTMSWIDERDVAPLTGSAVRGKYEVTRHRCDVSRCSQQRDTVELDRHSRGSRYLVGSVGDATALMWRSPLGDVRMRLRGKVTSLLEDAEHGGFSWESPGVELLARDGRGLLLIGAPFDGGQATFGYIIDGGGARPITVR